MSKGLKILTGLLPLCLLSLPAACFVGSVPLSGASVLEILLSAAGLAGGPAPDAASATIVLRVRLARVTLAFGIGAALALAGTVFQGILRNPLADPFTLGVSSGAAFGAALAISLGAAAALLPFCALAGAALALGVVLALSAAAGGPYGEREILSREALVLAGVVVSAFLAALISLVKALDEESVSGIVFWIMGSLQNRSWQDFAVFLPCMALGLLPLPFMHRELDLLNLGDSEARQLGLSARKARLLLLLAASCLSAACVAVSGIIGFVGLIVPHFIRLLQGPKHGPLLLNSALAGGLLLLWADVLARSLLPGGIELPVSVITAMLGGPFFCFLLVRGRT